MAIIQNKFTARWFCSTRTFVSYISAVEYHALNFSGRGAIIQKRYRDCMTSRQDKSHRIINHLEEIETVRYHRTNKAGVPLSSIKTPEVMARLRVYESQGIQFTAVQRSYPARLGSQSCRWPAETGGGRPPSRSE